MLRFFPHNGISVERRGPRSCVGLRAEVYALVRTMDIRQREEIAMKRLFVPLVVALTMIATACGGSSTTSPTTPAGGATTAPAATTGAAATSAPAATTAPAASSAASANATRPAGSA